MHSFIYSVTESILSFSAYVSKPSCVVAACILMLSAIQRCDLSSQIIHEDAYLACN